MHKPRLLVLADDLTGALDTGVQFAKNGIKTLVYPFPPSEQMHNDDFPVRVINTNSRHCTPEQAGSIIKNAVSLFDEHSFYYKKTDSCLRGNIGAELQALIQARGNKQLVFVPAYPALNRVTRGGVQYIDNEPIHKSPMANDPLNPLDESFVPAIIAKQSAVPVQIVSLNEDYVRRSGLKSASESCILVFDAEKPEQLKNIAVELYENGSLEVSAGCAGFAEALMQVLPLEKSPHGMLNTSDKLPILVVSGSLHPVSINQLRASLKNYPGFSMNGDKAVKQCWIESQEAQTLIESCVKVLEEKRICILGSDASFGKSSPGEKLGIEDCLGEITKKIIQRTGPVHLVVFGGDTLLGVINSLGVDCILPQTEIAPGVAISRLPGREKGLLVSKSGAFGDQEVISRIIDYINALY